MKPYCAILALAAALSISAAKAEPSAYGPQLEGFAYPHPVQRFAPIELPELGHAPQVEAPEAFHRALLGGLGVPGR